MENNDVVYLKNWIAFKAIIDSCIEDTGSVPFKEYFIEKFERYILTKNPDEYKWGIHPSVRARSKYKILQDVWDEEPKT